MRKDLAIAVLITFLMSAMMFNVLPTGSQTTPQYDPWADINDDGVIDIFDIVHVAISFGTIGDPTKNVIISNKAQSYKFSTVIPPRNFINFNIPTAGFSKATLTIIANNSIPDGKSTFYLEARTGFLINDSYTFSNWFAVTEKLQYIRIPHILYPELPLTEPQIWLDPACIRLDNPQIGYKFNVTAMVREAEYHPLNIIAWQVFLEYNGYNLEVTRIIEPVWDPEYIFYNKTTMFLNRTLDALGHIIGGNRIAAGALLYPCSQPPSRGNGKLCIIEFGIKNVPKKGEQPITLNIDNNYTYLLDPDLNTIEVNKYNAVVQWGYDCITKTLDITGTVLIVECYNHNEHENVKVEVEVYLTT